MKNEDNVRYWGIRIAGRMTYTDYRHTPNL